MLPLTRRLDRTSQRIALSWPSTPHWLWLRSAQAILDRCFGFFAWLLGMAILATIPVLQIASLGYLLGISVRVAQTGTISAGFRGIRGTAAIGRAATGLLILLIPAAIIRHLRTSARLLEAPEATSMLGFVLLVYLAFAMVHWYWACLRGARIYHFLWPAPLAFLRKCWRGGLFRDGFANLSLVLSESGIAHAWRTGLKALLVGLAWIAPPTTLLLVASRSTEGIAVLLALLGGIWMAGVAGYLPFLQFNVARSGKWRDGFAVRQVHSQFRRAPILYLLTTLVTLAAAIPLYLLKAESIPQETYWLTGILFVLFALPAKFLLGITVASGDRSGQLRHPLICWTMRTLCVPICIAYALVVFLTQYTSWNGTVSLFEQHAFLLPIPFLGQ